MPFHNVFDFLKNPHNRDPMTRNKGLLCWVHILIYVIPQWQKCCLKYRVILNRVMVAPCCLSSTCRCHPSCWCPGCIVLTGTTVQCGAVMTRLISSISSKSSQWTPLDSPAGARCGMFFFVNTHSDLDNSPVTAVLFQKSCYIESRCGGALLQQVHINTIFAADALTASHL